MRGNCFLTKGDPATLTYASPTRIHAVTSATVKGFNRTYSYDAAGYVTSDGKRTYTWTSFGQLQSLEYQGVPELKDFSGNIVHVSASTVISQFDFDAAGSRARQTKERISGNDSREIETTLYLGAYEREHHTTKTNGSASPVLVKTVHRHSLGGGMIYSRVLGGSDPGTKLTNVITDHLGSTDALVVGIWNGSTFASQTTEYQSFDAWGERRDAATQISYRASDTDPFRTSAKDHDRGYTGHEQLDDSGLIHMNGRIFDPELGRFLSPDPVVQIPEYSQNFNRYSYVLNNPLNATDPSGFSFISKAFSKIGSFLKENWRTIVSIVVVTALAFTLTPFGGIGLNLLSSAFGISGGFAQGAMVGALAGGFNAAINGGDIGDVLRGAVVGGIQGGISGSILHGWADGIGTNDNMFLHIAGHGVVGGGANEALGGKFQDGFLSAAAGAVSTHLPFAEGHALSKTIKASVVGGTASALGGGKFANGAWTAAFQHLLNEELMSKDDPRFWGKVLEEMPGQLFSGKNHLAAWKNSMAANGANILGVGLFKSIGGLFKFGSKAPAAASSGENLVHLSTKADEIAASAKLGLPSNNYAGPASNAALSGWKLTFRTGLSPSGNYGAVAIPATGEAAFSKVVPIGLMTAWQRLMGHQYTARGIMNLSNGNFTRTGVNWNQVGMYATDATITGGAIGAASYLVNESQK